VGGGIAGLSTAIFLARDGHRVDVFERAREIPPAGAGLLLQPAGLDVMRVLGVYDAAVARGSPIERVVARRGDAVLTDLRYAALQPGLHALGIRRPALAQILSDATRAAGAALRFGEAVAAVERRDSGVALRVAGATQEYDFALICDGTGSRLRDAVGKARVRPHATGVFTSIGAAPAGLDERALMQRIGDGDAAGMLPVGRDGGGAMASFFWNARTDEVAALRARGFAAWRDSILAFCPEASALLSTMKSFDALTWYATAEVSMSRWHFDRIAVLGDAAHALDPHLGVGATMALLDGETLSLALRGTRDVNAALANWEIRRRAQIAPYMRMSRLWSRLDHWRLAGLRRASFRLLARSSLGMRRRLLRYMSGR
ncbi:MAG: FAD-dependent monooxygenase, partial [Steroidobacteraceae bacterium]|nr:FAD-dependent monooxygenase [Steroidobacteraceae bacterium]